MTFKDPPPHAETLVSINDVPLGTQGNLLCVTGSEVTGKSSYMGSLLPGAVSGTPNLLDNLGTDVAGNTHKKAVLLYDTEQSEVQLYKNISNVLKRAGLREKPDFFKAYCLTSLARKERLQSYKAWICSTTSMVVSILW